MNQIYDQIGRNYRQHRRTDPRIAAAIFAALGDCAPVVNVGAGAGSYEPEDRRVIALEPSAQMVRQRAPGKAPAVRGVATALPFADGAFAAAMAILTVHHWGDWAAGVREMRRVARERVVILTHQWEGTAFWLVEDYFPEVLELDGRELPPPREIERVLGALRVVPVPVPHDCLDGFLGAYWRRPEAYLDAEVRQAISPLARLKDPEPGVRRLREDLASGRWEERYGHLRGLEALDLGYRLLVADVRR